jgi:hypothetical protein
MELALSFRPRSSSSGPALLSDDGRYRYRLTRRWNDSLPCVMEVGHNPAATGHRSAVTVHNLTRLVSANGYGAFTLCNLYAGVGLNGPSPLADSIGPDNDRHLHSAAYERELIVLAWGDPVDPCRARQVASPPVAGILSHRRAAGCVGLDRLQPAAPPAGSA